MSLPLYELCFLQVPALSPADFLHLFKTLSFLFLPNILILDGDRASAINSIIFSFSIIRLLRSLLPGKNYFIWGSSLTHLWLWIMLVLVLILPSYLKIIRILLESILQHCNTSWKWTARHREVARQRGSRRENQSKYIFFCFPSLFLFCHPYKAEWICTTEGVRVNQNLKTKIHHFSCKNSVRLLVEFWKFCELKNSIEMLFWEAKEEKQISGSLFAFL